MPSFRSIRAVITITLATALTYALAWILLVTSGAFWFLAKHNRLKGLPLPIVQLMAAERGDANRGDPTIYRFMPIFPIDFQPFRWVIVYVDKNKRVTFSEGIID